MLAVKLKYRLRVGNEFPLFSISWVYLYSGEKKGLKNGRDAFYDLFMGTPHSLFSGRKLGIEVNGAKQVNVPNFYLIISEFTGIEFEFLRNIFSSVFQSQEKEQSSGKGKV